MDDLDKVEKAKKNDPEALEDLKNQYSSFFDGTSTEEALNHIEKYLEGEFPVEMKRSELEADCLEAQGRGLALAEQAEKLKKEAEETKDPDKKKI
jgi:cell wall assembly regulator SMI1